MLIIFSFLLSGQLFILYRQRDSSPPKLFTALLGMVGNGRAAVGPFPGRLKSRLSHCDWDLVRALDVVGYLYSGA